MDIALRIGRVDIPTCDPEATAPSGLSGLSVTWGRDGRLDVPPASTCTFELVDSDGGTSYHDVVEFNSEVRVWAVMPDGSTIYVFVGTVTDLAVTRDEAGDTIIKVTAIDYTARMSAISMGDTPWPQQSSQARWQAINDAIPTGVEVSIPNTVPNVTMAAMDVDNQSIAQVVEDFAWGLGRVPWPITTFASGSLTVLAAGYKFTSGVFPPSAVNDTRASRRDPVYGLTTTTRVVCIDACDIDLDGTEFTTNPDDVRQPIRVTYGGSGTEGTYNLDNVGVVVDQSRRFDVTSGVAAGSGPATVAGQWLRQMADWDDYFDAPWRAGAVRVDADSVTGIDQFDQVLDLLLDFTRRIDRPVLLQQLPTWTPWRAATDHTHEPNVVGRAQGGTYTFTEGRWVLEVQIVVDRPLAGALAPAPVVIVAPGDQVPYDHNTGTVDFVADPSTPWQPGQVAYFNDGAYGWNGTEWVSGGVQPIIARPSATLAVAHDDPRVRPQPTTPWAADDYATFTDGRYRWDGNTWVVYRLPNTVWPYANVTYPHAQAGISADPQSAWYVPGSRSSVWAPAWFSDGTWSWRTTYWGRAYVVEPGGTLLNDSVAQGTLLLPAITPWPIDPWTEGQFAIIGASEDDWNTWRWDGTAWALTPVSSVVVSPGSVVDVPHDNMLVTPEPTTAWAADEYAVFSDGAYRWDGTAWVAVGLIVSPGDTVPVAHTDASVTASPTTAWDALDYATFSDGTYRWSGSAWVAVTLVAPGEDVLVPHDDPTLIPDPTTAWAEDDYATFSDGRWRWDGDAWAAYDVVVSAGDTVDLAHDDPAVVPDPMTGWPEGDYATFTDGTYRWNGTAWAAVTPVSPGDVVDIDHDDPAAIPDPVTAWEADDYAVFGDGRYRWDGDAWVAYEVVNPLEPWPGKTLAIAHDDPTLESPGVPVAWPWENSVYSRTVAGFSDGYYAWRSGEDTPQGYWQQVYSLSTINNTTNNARWVAAAHDSTGVKAPTAAAEGAVALFTDGPFEARSQTWVPTDRAGYDGATVPYTHDDPTVVAIPQVPWPTTTAEARGHPLPYVMFTDGRYRWDGTAWVAWTPPPPDTTWGGAPEGTAWDDVPTGTSWSDWNGEA